MIRLDSTDALLAAAFALVNGRCRPAYIHDLNGGLQSLHSAVELLLRSAGTSTANPSMAEKAASLTKRALASHEAGLQAFILHSAPSHEAPSAVDIGTVMAEIMQLLRNDALSKSLQIELQLASDVIVATEANTLRMLVLGLCVTSMDGLPEKSPFVVAVQQASDMASIRITTTSTTRRIPEPIADWLGQSTESIANHEFLIGVAAEWVEARGGRLRLESEGAAATVVLTLPLSRGSSAES